MALARLALRARVKGQGRARLASLAKEKEKELTNDTTSPKWYLPEWAMQEPAPLHLKVLGASLLLPLGAGSLAVHLLAEAETETPGEGTEMEGTAGSEGRDVAELVEVREMSDQSRVALNWSLHYAGALLSCAGALHWGMQAAELGVPLRSDYMGLYYLSRFSGPAVFVFFGWVGSVLSTALPVEAALWLLTGFVGLFSFDFLSWAYHLTPRWWIRYRAAFSGLSVAGLFVLLLSERNLYLGQKPKIRM
ncbi:unnamed protein product [Effrenium voratum]|nr:unnamed protein product [Effrenium voratum]